MKKLENSRSQKTSAKSLVLTQALEHVKDFMTEPQKALVLLKEGKICMETGDLIGAIQIFSEAITYNPMVNIFILRL
jgi:hypothetical protein